MSGAGDLWSRRRAAVAAEERADAAEADARQRAEEQARLEEKSDAEILAELDLPEPESLNAGDDFTVFMARAVPERIRRRALRVLWRSNPALANLDMMVDYGDDFTDGATVLENMQSAYQVGKGMLKHVEELARQAEEEEVLPDAAGAEAPALALTQEGETQTGAAPPADVEKTDVETADMSDEEGPILRPRRMKFRSEETA